jgi:hypothetical protein
MFLPFLLPHEVRSSWQVAYDMPEELQFMAYIGRAESFTPPDGSPAMRVAPTQAETDWRAWWDRMLIDNVSLRFERARAAMPDASLAEQARSVNPKDTFDPPTFDALDAPASVRMLCRRYWPSFQAEWDAPGAYGEYGKRWLIDVQQRANQRLNLNQIVYQCVRAAGKRVSAPFRLRFDVALWPTDYLRHISNAHAVIGAGYLAPERADDYRALHASSIARLV